MPEMLAAAADLFSERGFTEVSMDEIAERCGVSKPLLYSYFGSKERLFVACAEEAGARLRSRLEEVVSGSSLPPDERLWQGLLAVFDFVEHHRRSWRLLYPAAGGSAGELREGAARAEDDMAALLQSLFTETAAAAGLGADAQAQLGPLARGFTAMTIAMASVWAERPEEPKELAAMRVMNLAWVGFERMLGGEMWLPDEAG